jgi:subfamily B ATP-binding cassette protein MsbA
VKKRNSFFRIIWQAGKKDLFLGLPWLPIYSLAEISLALLVGILLQLVFVTNNSIELSSLVPGRLKNYVHWQHHFYVSDLIYLIPIAIVVVSFVKFVSGFMSSYLTERAGHRIAHKLREEMLSGFLSSFGNKLDQKNPDYVANQLMQDTTLLQGAVSKGTISAIRDFLVLIGIIISMLFISWQTFIIGICVVVPVAVLLKKIAKKLNFYTQNGQKKQINISSRFLSTYHGALTVHALRSQNREAQDFKDLNDDNYRFMHQSLFVRTFFSPAMEFFGVFVLALVFYWRLSYVGDFQASTYSAMVVLLAFSFRYIKNIAGTITFFSEIQIVLSRVKSYLSDYDPASKHQALIDLPSSSPHAIEALDVSFKTDGGRDILSHCAMTIAKGKKVAFIGESGAGKTTFLRILAGLVIPTEGKISITPEFLLASQTPYIFKGSVKENIVYANKSFSEHMIDDKCKELILALSLSYSDFGAQIFLDKNLGFLGDGLSGGEKARVSLARVLYSNPKLILLDEPTANLDAQTAKLFWQAIDAWKSKDSEHTVVAVSHAIHEVLDFDVCYLFESGKIVRFGSPQEVLKNA